MRHQRTGKKLGRDSAHRRALYANLAGALIEHGRIKTTVTKAKAVKPLAEQMITLGRRGDLHARRQAVAVLRSKDIVHMLFDEVGPKYAERPGGYTRIIRLGPRQGDSAEMCYLELVGDEAEAREETRGAAREETPAVEDAAVEADAEDEDEDEEEDEDAEEEEGEDGDDEPSEEPSDSAEPVADDEADVGAEKEPEPAVEAEPAASAEGEEPEASEDAEK
jgi:large subunit ribosomal protein L17